MKKLYFSFICINMTMNIFSQRSVNIENEKIRVNVNSNGNLFDNSKSDTLGFNFPKDSNISTMFSNGIWIAGKDANGQSHMAANKNNLTDFTYGPYGNSSINQTNWDKVWVISQVEIDQFISSGSTTEAILTWPGNGDLSLGQASKLAPFYDNPDINGNTNGIYICYSPFIGQLLVQVKY